jgi:uncharacterized protein involved in exopolysaccharide biosynthesis
MINSQFLSLVWRRKLLFLAISCTIFSAISATVLLWPRTYVASATLLLNSKSGKPSSADIATQIDILNSSRVAGKVVEILQIGSNAAAVKRFQNERNPDQSLIQFYSEQLKLSRTIKAVGDAYVLEVSYRARDAAFAALAANAFAKAHIDANEELLGSGNAIVLDHAQPPQTAASPKTFLGLLAATIVAPLIGLLAVLLNEALDRRVRNRQDLEETTGVTILCIVGPGKPSRTLAVFRTMYGFLFSSTRTHPKVV